MSEKPTIYDETARLEQTTTTNPAECECVNWCSDGLHRREELLAGHHFRCERFEREYVRRSLDLIAQLYRAMQQWGAEEDGVPDFAWDAWVVAGEVTTGKYQGAKKAGTA